MNARTLFVKPKTGFTIRYPLNGQPLPAEGAEVPDTGYWQRRLRDGDVQLTTAPKKAKE